MGKRTSYTSPWTRDSQCQNSAYSLARNTPNASQNFSLICLPKPKSFKFLKKSSLWVSIVRAQFYSKMVSKMYRLFIDILFKLLLSNRSGRTFSNSSGVLSMNNFEIQCNMALLMGGLRKSSFVTMKKTSTKYSIKCSSKIDTSSIPPVYPQYTPNVCRVYLKYTPE